VRPEVLAGRAPRSIILYSRACATQELRRFSMAISTVHLEKAGTTFAGLWEECNLDVIGALYHEDAVFISPNPPSFLI
jgi:hypothetical protein